MKRSYTIAIMAFVLATAPVSGLAWTRGPWNGTIHRMESDIQSQLARIQHAKEISSSATALTRIRVAQQLHRAEQELERHLANLERIRESLEDQANDLGSPYGVRKGQQQQGTVGTALSRLEAQIKAADALLARVEAFRSSVDEPAVPSSIERNTPRIPSPDDWASNAKAGPTGSLRQDVTAPGPPPHPAFH